MLNTWQSLVHADPVLFGWECALTGVIRARGTLVVVLPGKLLSSLNVDFLRQYAQVEICAVGTDTATEQALAREALGAAQLLHSGRGAVLLAAELVPQLAQLRISSELRELVAGERYSTDELVEWISAAGYGRQAQVEASGEWSRRGGVLDLWVPGQARPVRLDFWADELERIRVFDPATQLSFSTLERVRLPRLLSPEGSGDNFWQLCELAGLAIIDREPCLELMYHSLRGAAGQDQQLRAEQLMQLRSLLGAAMLLEPPRGEDAARVLPYRLPEAVASSQQFPLEPRFLALRKLLQEGKHIWLSAPSQRHVKGLKQLMEPYALHPYTVNELPRELPLGGEKAEFKLWVGPALPMAMLESRVLLLDESTLIHGAAYHARKPRSATTIAAVSLEELVPGDIVVHEEYGIGRFARLERREQDGHGGEFLRIEYANAGVVYLPVDRIYLLEKLASGDAQTELDVLGSGKFAKRKARARDDALRYATELLQNAALRATGQAPALPPPERISTALSVSFPYELTPDQERSVEEIYSSMSADKPMDRLLIGDVGFGKTEVAVRAAGYAVEHGYQVVLLAPTTILAFQHARTFTDRMAALGVRIAFVNRFRSTAENTAVMRAFGQGTVDVLIGTHRVLQRDFHAAKLGLVIIDEEHKFGVLQKEKLNTLRSQAHRLTMSATPIPRSLNFSLAGLREISMIVTPPPSRQAVETQVIPLDEDICRSVLARELERGGQVYVVAPHIRDLEQLGQSIRLWAPGARVGIGHGQLSGEAMEQLFLDFWEKRIDILVSTSIIESGLDVTNANTILIFSGHMFGLADLYQLRGRVGRSERKGYCQVIVPHAQQLTDNARRRLDVIERFSRLGSGYQVALYDLEIRGAGEVLGTRQSGLAQSIGMNLYARMLEEAIAELEKQPVGRLPEPDLRTWFSTSIDPKLELHDAQRIEIYRLLFVVEGQTEYQARAQHVMDRYNLHPEQIAALGYAAMARGYARRSGVAMLDWRREELRIGLHPESAVDRGGLVQSVAELGLKLRPDSLLLPLPKVEVAQDRSFDPQQLAGQWERIQPFLARLAVLGEPRA